MFWTRFETVPGCFLSFFLYPRKLQLSSFATMYAMLLKYPGRVVKLHGVLKKFKSDI